MGSPQDLSLVVCMLGYTIICCIWMMDKTETYWVAVVLGGTMDVSCIGATTSPTCTLLFYCYHIHPTNYTIFTPKLWVPINRAPFSLQGLVLFGSVLQYDTTRGWTLTWYGFLSSWYPKVSPPYGYFPMDLVFTWSIIPTTRAWNYVRKFQYNPCGIKYDLCLISPDLQLSMDFV